MASELFFGSLWPSITRVETLSRNLQNSLGIWWKATELGAEHAEAVILVYFVLTESRQLSGSRSFVTHFSAASHPATGGTGICTPYSVVLRQKALLLLMGTFDW